MKRVVLDFVYKNRDSFLHLLWEKPVMASVSPVVLSAIPLAAIWTAVYSILTVTINTFPQIGTETIPLENDSVTLSGQLKDIVKSKIDNIDISRSIMTGCIQIKHRK